MNTPFFEPKHTGKNLAFERTGPGPDDWRLRAVTTHDARFLSTNTPVRGRRSRDEVLTATPPGKLIVGATIWNGSLAPFVDAAIAAVGSYVAPGRSLGQPLNPEPSPQSLDLGRRWLGDVSRALTGQDGAPDADTDVTEVLKAVASLQQELGTQAPCFQGIQDSLSRLKAARAAVRTPTGDTAKNWGTAFLQRSRDNSRRMAAAMKTTADHLTATRTGDRDTVTEVREHIGDMHRATNARDQGEALNAAHRAMWGTGSFVAHLLDSELARPPQSDAERNAQAQAFWAARK